MKNHQNVQPSFEQLESELKEARSTIQNLKGKVEMYQRVINHLPHYYTFWKDLDLRFLGGDERFFTKGGYASMEEMIGKTDYDCAWIKEADGFRNIDKMVVNQNLQSYTVIEQQTPADGKTVWLSTTKVAVNDDQGNVIGLVGVSDDVTEKLQREKILRDSENRFRQLSEASSEGVAIHKEGIITDTNLFLADMFSYDPKELVGLELVKLFSPESHKTFNERLLGNSSQPFRAVGVKYNMGLPTENTLGFDIEITLRNDPIQAISIRDISEQIKVEQIKDDFLANTSHELRTPLNGIIGVSESLIAGVAGELPEKVVSNLAMIISSSRRLYNLVNDILDYSKIRNESLKLEKKVVNLKDISESIVGLSQPLVVSKPLRLINDIPENLPAVIADEDRLQQILYNLIGNAIKFTAQGEVRVFAEVEQDRVKVSVSDTGVGIPNSRQKEIFKSFQQADSSISRDYGGTGLGLSISRQLVQLHGSKLRVKSVPEKGSTFYFYLDKSTSDASPAQFTKIMPSLTSFAVPEPLAGEIAPVEPMSKPFIPLGRGQKILVVDDEPINLQMIQNVLQLHEYEVMTAQSGFQALDIIQSDCPDLVILDIMMPRMDGYELCGLIRQSFDAWQLPILFLTAKNQVSDRVKGLSSGANDFLTKPFYQEELLIRVKTHLRVKESFETVRENQQLKIQIHRHKEAELELENSNRRICGILDLYENILIAVDENLDVVYLNKEAEGELDLQKEHVLNKPVKHLLTVECITDFQNTINEIDAHGHDDPQYSMGFDLKIIGEGDTEKVLPTKVTFLELDEECIYTFTAFHMDRGEKHSIKEGHVQDPVYSKQQLQETIKKKLLNAKNIALLEGVFTSMYEEIHASGLGGISKNSVEQKQVELKQKSKVFYQQKEFRVALVTLMNLSVSCWKESSGKSKWQLAEESGLWKAYLDQGVYKTRTMNKYLKEKVLPMNPKWNRVLDTAEFVLSNYQGMRNESYYSLEKNLSEMLQSINTHILIENKGE